MNERLRTVISMGLFVVLAGYVGFSGIRLGAAALATFWRQLSPESPHLRPLPHGRRPPHP